MALKQHELITGEALDLMFFEGPEKLLKIWFVPEGEKDKLGLRSIPREEIVSLLKLVKCTILSQTSTDHFDAYVLSESSLFVYPYKIILKTCGTTTLLCAVKYILECAKKYCALSQIADVFYSRRNYLNEHAQREPHGAFHDEVRYLDQIFDGSAYILGKRNGDHWYLYLTDKDEVHDNSSSDSLGGKRLPSHKPVPPVMPSSPEYTLEILMTQLDRGCMKQFYKSPTSGSARDVSVRSGIADFIPGAVLDEFLFDPCGYSMNGLLGEYYSTIHVTPQPLCSYVSFETNVPPSVVDYPTLVSQVLKAFKPANFTITVFGGHVPSDTFSELNEEILSHSCLDGFAKRNKVRYEFENHYELYFSHFETKPVLERKEKIPLSVSDLSPIEPVKLVGEGLDDGSKSTKSDVSTKTKRQTRRQKVPVSAVLAASVVILGWLLLLLS